MAKKLWLDNVEYTHYLQKIALKYPDGIDCAQLLGLERPQSPKNAESGGACMELIDFNHTLDNLYHKLLYFVDNDFVKRKSNPDKWLFRSTTFYLNIKGILSFILSDKNFLSITKDFDFIINDDKIRGDLMITILRSKDLTLREIFDSFIMAHAILILGFDKRKLDKVRWAFAMLCLGSYVLFDAKKNKNVIRVQGIIHKNYL